MTRNRCSTSKRQHSFQYSNTPCFSAYAPLGIRRTSESTIVAPKRRTRPIINTQVPLYASNYISSSNEKAAQAAAGASQYPLTPPSEIHTNSAIDLLTSAAEMMRQN